MQLQYAAESLTRFPRTPSSSAKSPKPPPSKPWPRKTRRPRQRHPAQLRRQGHPGPDRPGTLRRNLQRNRVQRWLGTAPRKSSRRTASSRCRPRNPTRSSSAKKRFSHTDELLAAFTSARQTKAQITALDQILKTPTNSRATTSSPPSSPPLKDAAQKTRRLNTAQAL